MERDPVCGMTVDPGRAKSRVEHAGRTYFFCCEGCAKKFSAEPVKYLNAEAESAVEAPADSFLSRVSLATKPAAAARPAASHKLTPSAIYVCPMDPEVREEYPGACPKCGM